MTASRTTWYRPEFATDAASHTCYCHVQAHGRTAFSDGVQIRYRYQCRKHLPAVAVAFEYGDRS